jgi:hypothetical protein
MKTEQDLKSNKNFVLYVARLRKLLRKDKIVSTIFHSFSPENFGIFKGFRDKNNLKILGFLRWQRSCFFLRQ